MIEIEHNEVTDKYAASASVYEWGYPTPREALVAFRDQLERLIIECDNNIIREEDNPND